MAHPSIVSSSDSHDSQSSALDLDGSPLPAQPHQWPRARPAAGDVKRTSRERETSEQRSPTPTQRSLPSQRVSDVTVKPRRAAPPAPLQPQSSSPPALPAKADVEGKTSRVLTSDRAAEDGRSRKAIRARLSTPPHLDLSKTNKPNHRLRQDWIQIDFPGPSMEPARSTSAAAGATVTSRSGSPAALDRSKAAPRPASQLGSIGLPAATMVPMKSESNHARPNDRAELAPRPPFERASTAPTPPPPPNSDTVEGPREQKKGRVSLDQLRSNTSPEGAMPLRIRKNARSTPPKLVLDSAAPAPSSLGRMSLFRRDTKSSPSNAIVTGKESPNPPRPSEDISPDEREYLKAMQREQQRLLGIASTKLARPEMRSMPIDMERKSSGLSLKKSSGALKALFNRGPSGKGKDKDRAETPPIPSLPIERERLSSDAGSAGVPVRPSISYRQTSQPIVKTKGQDDSRGKFDSDVIPARPSFTSERHGYPAPPLQRTRSQGAQPGMSGVPMIESHSAPGSSIDQGRKISFGPCMTRTAQASGARTSDRDLPPLPPPSPNPEQFTIDRLRVHYSEALASGPTQLKTPTLVDDSPLLPYLSSTVASAHRDDSPGGAPATAKSTANKTSASSTLPFATAREPSPKDSAPTPSASAAKQLSSSGSATSFSSELGSFIPPSKSLHLLQLPNLDSDFGLSFDKIGVSPSTPRRNSPRKSRRSTGSNSPHCASPQRSLTTKISSTSTRISPALSRRNSERTERTERRRSKSFDGPTTGQMLGGQWRDIGVEGSFVSPSMAGLFASNSVSAPIFSMPLEASSSDDSRILSYGSCSSSSTVTPHQSDRSQSYQIEQDSFDQYPRFDRQRDQRHTSSSGLPTCETSRRTRIGVRFGVRVWVWV